MRPPVSPQPSPPSSPSATTKRPLSPPAQDDSSPKENGDSNKRRRLSSDQARGKRMFGDLMGTLTSFQKQTSARSKQVERRAEIDARVKERVAREKEVMDAEKEKLEKERRRKEEQVKMELETETVNPPPPRPWQTRFLEGNVVVGLLDRVDLVGAVTEFVGFGEGGTFIYQRGSAKDILSTVSSSPRTENFD